jgi:formylglycine-generating enzyme required for sulfatase activity
VPAGALGSTAVSLNTPSGTASVAAGFAYVNVTIPPWATLLQAEPDPAIVIDPVLRASIISTGYAWRVLDTATQIELLLIPPGTFQMGCSASSAWGCLERENPVHQVTLTQPFYMGRYEVTQAQWTARMGSNPSSFQSASAQVPAFQVPSRPVDNVSWNTIQGFLSTTGMRLPTEAEWEYAYRAGTTTAYHSMPGYSSGTNDDSLLGNIAWIGSSSGGQTRPVGQLAGNGIGLHDMSGNVWEWVNDWQDIYSSTALTNPIGPSSGTHRLLRGGSWVYGEDYLTVGRCSFRHARTPDFAHGDYGFRVARNP